MPYSLRKVRNKNCYRVYKRKTEKKPARVFSKCATKKNATKQLRLLRAIHYNKDFVPMARMTRKIRPRKTKRFYVLDRV